MLVELYMGSKKELLYTVLGRGELEAPMLLAFVWDGHGQAMMQPGE